MSVIRSLVLEDSAIVFNDGLEFLGFGRGDKGAGNEELSVETGGGVFELGLGFIGAKEEADERVVILFHDTVFPKVEIKIHLTSIPVFQLPGFQFNEEVAAENAVVKDKIDVIVPVADGHALLRASKQRPLQGSSRKVCRGSSNAVSRSFFR